MAESENQLELKKRARRRLVGSVALALTAAIVLPMVMDHEPKPLTQDIQIRIPSQEPTTVSRPAASRPATPNAEVSKPVGISAPDPVPTPEPPKASPKPIESDVAKPEAPPSTKTEVKPAPIPEPKSDIKVEPKADAKESAKAERESKVAAVPPANDAPAPAGQFIVQLGAFSDSANVGKVRTRIKTAGFSSYTESVKGPNGSQTRVRAGPFASREAAEQAATSLKHAGLPGVVAPK
jgi:DedD protein